MPSRERTRPGSARTDGASSRPAGSSPRPGRRSRRTPSAPCPRPGFLKPHASAAEGSCSSGTVRPAITTVSVSDSGYRSRVACIRAPSSCLRASSIRNSAVAATLIRGAMMSRTCSSSVTGATPAAVRCADAGPAKTDPKPVHPELGNRHEVDQVAPGPAEPILTWRTPPRAPPGPVRPARISITVSSAEASPA